MPRRRHPLSEPACPRPTPRVLRVEASRSLTWWSAEQRGEFDIEIAKLLKGSARTVRSTSKVIRIDHRLGERLRIFLRQVVADAAADQPELVFAGEALGVILGSRVRCAVGIAFKGDGRHTDGRRRGQFLLERFVLGLSPWTRPRRQR